MKQTKLWMLAAILAVCAITVGCGRNRQADRQQSAEQWTAEVTFTHSTWALIEKGAQFQYVRQKALPSKITAEMAFEGVSNFCHSAYDWSAAEENPDIMGLEMGEETDSTYHVVFRSYTGALVNFYVDKASGTTRMVEYVPALDRQEEAGTINLFEYFK